jgi:DNA polymerase III epsilon subunit-like protein
MKSLWLSENKQMYEAPVAVIDFETTGLDTSKARAIQVAIVHSNLGCDNAELVYEELIHPGELIPEETTAIHGISDTDMVDKKPFADHVDNIMAMLEGRIICAYNLSYDWSILNAELKRLNREPLPWFGFCAKVLASYVDAHIRGRGTHRQISVAGRRGIEYAAHDAAEDAKVASMLMDKLLVEAVAKRGEKFGSVREYWAFQRAEGIAQEMDLRRYFQSKGIERNDWPWTDW